MLMVSLDSSRHSTLHDVTRCHWVDLIVAPRVVTFLLLALLFRTDNQLVDVGLGLLDLLGLTSDDDLLVLTVLTGDGHPHLPVVLDVSKLGSGAADDDLVEVVLNVHLLVGLAWVGELIVAIHDDVVDHALCLLDILGGASQQDLALGGGLLGLALAVLAIFALALGAGGVLGLDDQVEAVLDLRDHATLLADDVGEAGRMDLDLGFREVLVVEAAIAVGSKFLDGLLSLGDVFLGASNDEAGAVGVNLDTCLLLDHGDSGTLGADAGADLFLGDLDGHGDLGHVVLRLLLFLLLFALGRCFLSFLGGGAALLVGALSVLVQLGVVGHGEDGGHLGLGLLGGLGALSILPRAVALPLLVAPIAVAPVLLVPRAVVPTLPGLVAPVLFLLILGSFLGLFGLLLLLGGRSRGRLFLGGLLLLGLGLALLLLGRQGLPSRARAVVELVVDVVGLDELLHGGLLRSRLGLGGLLLLGRRGRGGGGGSRCRFRLGCGLGLCLCLTLGSRSGRGRLGLALSLCLARGRGGCGRSGCGRGGLGLRLVLGLGGRLEGSGSCGLRLLGFRLGGERAVARLLGSSLLGRLGHLSGVGHLRKVGVGVESRFERRLVREARGFYELVCHRGGLGGNAAPKNA
mmetsp:Transcript_79450/g.164963  ORF Transcript_79450/g.164963 Transcript_79450/m.164963 type:complete len:630 (-) Transcript_79450:5-1894(-)